MDFLNETILDNSVQAWLIGLAVGVTIAVFLRGLVPRLIRRLTRLAHSTSSYLDDSLAEAAAATKGFFYLVLGAYAAAYYLYIPADVEPILDRVLASAVLVQVGFWLVAGYRSYLSRARDAKYPDDPEVATSFHLVQLLGSAVIWFLIAVFVLQAWGMNVTALVTGLGIGGIAIALAVQSILADLFASLSIIFDKPFLVGDFLAIDAYRGTVESIGLKTTQIRSITGEQVVFSNSDLLKSRIRNYGRMEERRGDLAFGVVYETHPDVVEQVPGWVQEIVESEELTRFDRCHFKTLGQWALEFETVYYMTVPDYRVFMDVQQRINLALMRRLSSAGVEFAYPTHLQYERRLDSAPAASVAGRD